LNTNEIISSGLLELFVLGKTTEQETAQVLEWKAALPDVAAELLAIENDLEMMDKAIALKPSLNTKQQLFESIKETKIKNVTPLFDSKVKKINYWKYAAAASVALLLGTIIFSYNKTQSLKNELANVQLTLNNQQQQLAALNEGIEGAANISSQQVVLKGLPTSPTSTAKIFWVRNTGNVFIEASGLPSAPKGFQYQLWAIIDGKPVDGGMIKIEENNKKYNIQKMKSFGNAQAFAITLEKEGGSATPTMEKMVVMSKI
jgi:anti-sigma-K factor RskA